MRPTLNDVHQQFAAFFHGNNLEPFAYLVSKRLSEGHICVDLSVIDAEKENLPSSYWPAIDNVKDLPDETQVGGPRDNQPFILHHERLYLKRYFDYETMILAGIFRLLKAESGIREKRCKDLLRHKAVLENQFSPRSNSPGIDWQLAGVLCGAINNLTIITGGPGTGKTTTLAKLLTVLYALEPALKIALAAPTGKAAMRMAESLRKAMADRDDAVAQKIYALEPMTLHRLLRPILGTPHFRHHAENPLTEDVIVIDEASMIDAALLAKLFDAVSDRTRLILLGDKNQLASVEAGSILGDLCQDEGRINVTDRQTSAMLSPICLLPEAGADHPLSGHIVELKENHRFKEDSGIGRLSQSILRGETDTLQDEPGIRIDTSYDPSILWSFFDQYESFIREPDIASAYEKFNELRILCAVREGERGVYRMNSLVEEYLSKKGLIHPPKGEFYENRPVMIGRNYYELELFNGDTGIIRPDETGTLKAWFPDGKGGMRGVLPYYVADAQTVFAMTVHKSQGSEFNRVLVVLPEYDPGAFLTRELLYTAVTRARQEVIIQGAEEVIHGIVHKTVRRVSGINERFTDGFSLL